jgi:hypothetical protein
MSITIFFISPEVQVESYHVTCRENESYFISIYGTMSQSVWSQ